MVHVPSATLLIKYLTKLQKLRLQLFLDSKEIKPLQGTPPIKISLTKGKVRKFIYYENRCHLEGRGNNAKKNLPMCQWFNANARSDRKSVKYNFLYDPLVLAVYLFIIDRWYYVYPAARVDVLVCLYQGGFSLTIPFLSGWNFLEFFQRNKWKKNGSHPWHSTLDILWLDFWQPSKKLIQDICLTFQKIPKKIIHNFGAFKIEWKKTRIKPHENIVCDTCIYKKFQSTILMALKLCLTVVPVLVYVHALHSTLQPL